VGGEPHGAVLPWRKAELIVDLMVELPILIVQGCKNSNVFLNPGYNFFVNGCTFLPFLTSKNYEILKVYFNPHFETVLMHLDVISATFLHPGS
jgi:hypothetical protein